MVSQNCPAVSIYSKEIISNKGVYLNNILTIFVHRCSKTFVEPTGAALVPVGLVDGTFSFQIPRCLAGIYPVAVDAALEKPGATCW